MNSWKATLFALVAPVAVAQAQPQFIEGFSRVEFHHNANRSAASRDFRGMAPGYLTAGWWAPGQMARNWVSWRTAVVPVKQTTTFAFIGATSVLPSEFSRGPRAKLTVNGHYALTFSLGVSRDFTWKEGGCELKYLSRRIEYPYFNAHRQLELNGNSGIFQLTVPATMIEAGQPALLQVEILPFAAWSNSWFMVKHRTDTWQPSAAATDGELEALRQDMAALQQQTQVLATQVYKNLLGADRFVHGVVYHNGFRHLHPADLIQLQNGELLVLTREATEHYANDGDVVMVRSKDGGRTWGGREVVAAIKDVDEREGCGVQLRDGTIVVGVFYNNLYNPDGSYNFNWKRVPPPLQRAELGLRYLGAYVITSQDNGHTWSAPGFIDTKGMPYADLEGPTDAPIEMPDGSILMAMTGDTNADPGNRSAIMLRSTDQGKTWRFLATMASDPGGKLGGFVEPGIVRTKTGRIVVGLRNHGPDQAIWVTHSDDDGKTWAPVRKTEMIGHPTDLIQLSDGRLLASYGIRTAHARPMGVRACFSRDNGETWDIASEVQLRNDFGNWDVGYPESLELPDGRVLTVYYYNQLGKYYIGSTTWKP